MIRILLAMYPARWRRRYGEEFRAVLESRPLGPFDVADVVLGAVDARLTRFRLVGATGPQGGHAVMLRIGGLGAIGGGILWFAGIAGTSSGFEPDALWLATAILGSLGILAALIGMSAFQARRDPRLAWAAFAIPAIGTILTIVGFVAGALLPDAWLVLGGFTAWGIWLIGLTATVIGSLLFAIATLRVDVLSSRPAQALAASAVLVLIVAFGLGGGGDGPTALGRVVTALGLGGFAASWVALGVAALRRGPIVAIPPA